MIFFMVRRAMSFTELMDCLPNGFKQMVPAILILCLAWTIGDVTKALGFPEFVADLVSKFGPGLKNFLPAVVFLIAAFLGFATGTSWGTFTILLPIVIPVFSGGIPAADLTSELINGNDMLMIAIAATLGGAVMGDHCSPISDTTIMAPSGPMLPPQPRGDSAALRHDGGRRVLRKLHSRILYSECGYQSGHCHCVYGSSPAGDRQAEPLHEPPLPARLKSAELIKIPRSLESGDFCGLFRNPEQVAVGDEVGHAVEHQSLVDAVLGDIVGDGELVVAQIQQVDLREVGVRKGTRESA